MELLISAFVSVMVSTLISTLIGNIVGVYYLKRQEEYIFHKLNEIKDSIVRK